jgi:hypothetical protein
MKMISSILTAVAASALATGAMAQVSNVQSSTSASQTLDGSTTIYTNPVPSPNFDNGGPGGAGYSASAAIDDGSIFFQAGSMSAGRRNAASSEVIVSFDVTGQSDTAITQIRSTFFESNFGFYIGNFTDFVDPDTGDLIVGCSGANLPNCVPTTFAPGFSAFVAPGDTSPPITLATTQFTFEVLQDGDIVRSVSGSLDAVRTESGVIFTEGLGFSELASALNNFTLFEVPGNPEYQDKVYAFSWDRTDFTAELLNAIGNGETSNISYRIATSTVNYATPAFSPPSANLLVAFACAADPIGRGSVGAIFTIPGFSANTCTDYAADGSVTPFALKIPRIVGNTLDFTAGIPEPDTWAMLIIGFGLVGLSMRRTKKPVAATVSA